MSETEKYYNQWNRCSQLLMWMERLFYEPLEGNTTKDFFWLGNWDRDECTTHCWASRHLSIWSELSLTSFYNWLLDLYPVSDMSFSLITYARHFLNSALSNTVALRLFAGRIMIDVLLLRVDKVCLGRWKCGTKKMQDRKMQDQKCMGGKYKTGNEGPKIQGWKLQDWKM